MVQCPYCGSSSVVNAGLIKRPRKPNETRGHVYQRVRCNAPECYRHWKGAEILPVTTKPVQNPA